MRILYTLPQYLIHEYRDARYPLTTRTEKRVMAKLSLYDKLKAQ